jgi:HlyD family secretion protein
VQTRSTITVFATASVALAALVLSRGRGPADVPAPVAVAERRDLEVTLVEPGTLQAARAVTLSSEIRSNRAKISWLAADGTWVKPGDVVVRFDPTPFEEARAKAAAEARDAEAAVVRAEQEKKLQIAKAEEALESARHGRKVAGLNLEAYEKGSGALNVREAEVKAAESGSELERMRHDMADLEAMFHKGFVSEGELARERLKLENLERQSGLQKDRLKTARDVLYPRDLERAKTQVEEAKDAVARAEAVLYYSHEFYRAAIESAQRKADTTREALRVAEDELAKTALASPLEGFLILQEISLDTGRRLPQVGDSVWSGQPIATLPDLSELMVDTRVREVDLHQLRQGVGAEVAVEAYPDLRLAGRVDFIGSLAQAAADSPWKFFSVRVALGRSDARLRPGMSARVSFAIDSVSNAIVAPADAVFTRGDRTVCYVRRGEDVWEQEVVVGKRSDTHVELRQGVAAGEELLLAEPKGRVRQRVRPEPAA